MADVRIQDLATRTPLDTDVVELDGPSGSGKGTIPGLRTKVLDGHEGVGGAVHPDVVSSGASGFMAGTDKAKLDTVQANAVAAGTSGDAHALVTTGNPHGLDASEVPFTPNGDIAATDVQAAVVEVRDDTDTKLSAHTSDTGNPHSVTAAQAGASPENRPQFTFSGTTGTIDDTQKGGTVFCDGATGCTVTVDQAEAGNRVDLVQGDTDSPIELAAGSGVSFLVTDDYPTPLTTLKQYARIGLEWRTATQVYVTGELATV
jgi:hypothetical protein